MNNLQNIINFEPASVDDCDQYEREQYENRCRGYFLLKVPEEFLEPIDRSRKTIDWNAFDKIQQWDGVKSITARGPSQLGKTRAIYQVLMSEFRSTGKTFSVINEFRLMSKVADASSDKKLGHLANVWIDEDVLFFDDIDKVNFGQGVTGKTALTLVFGVIKARMARHRPTILSYNLAIKDFFAEAGEHTVNSLIERIKQPEHWMSVEFKQPKP